jgi:hypothetical protein
MIADEYLHNAHPQKKDDTLLYSSANEGILAPLFLMFIIFCRYKKLTCFEHLIRNLK